MREDFSMQKERLERSRYHSGDKYRFVYTVATAFILFALTQNSIPDILNGIYLTVARPDTLITDYMALGCVGAAFANSGIILMCMAQMLQLLRIRLTGAHFAALFIVAGFAMFGKNLLNIWFPLFGVWLYSVYKKESFTRHVLIALYSTGLAPIVSEIIYFEDLPYDLSIPVGLSLGILLGFIMPPLATAMVRFHQGLNLYNAGFTAGAIGTVFMSILRSFGYYNSPVLIWKKGCEPQLVIFLFLLFSSVIVYGFIRNGNTFKGYRNILNYSGRLITDFIILEGPGLTFVNMGIMGLLGTLFVILIGGDLNGPTIGAILTIVGFAAFGKHPKNTFPIVLGLVFAASLQAYSINDPAIQMAALFSTCLAPVAGEFGSFWGFVSGFAHVSVVQYVGVLHAGVNLYNNGFSAGIVAAVVAPLAETFGGKNR